MTAPDAHAALLQRVTALEENQFELVVQLERLTEAVSAACSGLDSVETALDELHSLTLTPDPDEWAEAMAVREAQLAAQDPASSPDPDPDPDPDLDLDPATPPVGGGLVVVEAGQIVPPLMISSPTPTVPPELVELWAWVDLHIAPLVRRTTTTGEGGGVRWCRRWWEHADAVTRLHALQLAYGELVEDDSATWLSVFLRDHVDPHMAQLTSASGPFYACHPLRHSPTAPPLGHDPLPRVPGAASATPSHTGTSR
jgi:Domain of unknown function (DUF4913)